MTTKDRIASDYDDELHNSARSQAHADARLSLAPLVILPLPARSSSVTIIELIALVPLTLMLAPIHMPPPCRVTATDTVKELGSVVT